MSVIWLWCCDRYLDLDFDCNDVVYFEKENEHYCIDHAIKKLEELGITDENELDKILHYGRYEDERS